MHFSQRHVCCLYICLATSVFAYFIRAGLVCVAKGICLTFAMHLSMLRHATEVSRQKPWFKNSKVPKAETFFLAEKERWASQASYAQGREGSVLVIPDESRVVSWGPSDDSLVAELWLTAQLGERDDSAREDSRLGRRSPDVVMSARSKKSSAVNILEEDLLHLQLLWSSIQGRGCISYDMSYRFQNTKHGERNEGTNECWHCV